jgi:cytochrome P450 family 26 subfamily A
MLGIDLDSAQAAEVARSFNEFSDSAFAVPIDLPGFAFHKGLKARKRLLEIISAHIEDVDSSCILWPMWRNELSSSSSSSSSSSEESSNSAPVDQSLVVDSTLELMYGSHETTMSMMCAAIVYLANNPHVIDTIRDELHAAGVDDVTSPLADDVSYDVLRTLTYTNDVVRELLRIQPAIAGAFRKTIKPMQIGEYVIPEGWGVLYGIADTHETSPMFDHQLDFDPSRWQRYRDSMATDGNSDVTQQKKQHKATDRYNYIPFGGGSKRFCVGKQFAKVVLAVFVVELVRAAKNWKLVNGTPQLRTAPIPIPSDDLPVSFRRQNDD